MINININHKTSDKPNVNLTVRRVEASAWRSLGFYKHHYLTSSLNPSCKCFVFFWNDEPICFIGLLNSPRKGSPNSLSISRIVVLPDYQGIGIAKKCIEFICGIAKNDNYVTYIKTIHERFGKYLTDSDKWEATSYNGKIRKSVEYEKGKYNNRLIRPSYCFKYIGNAINGYSDLLKPINELRKNK